MMSLKPLLIALGATLALGQGQALADTPPQSGFFEDYSKLQPEEAHWADYVYVNPKYGDEMPEFQAIIIPQPELFLAPDSEYRGMKPDNMKMITDSMRQIFMETLAQSYQMANSPGPGTVVLDIAFSNLYLKKKPRARIIGYLPPAYVATSLKRKFMDDFAENILLTELVWEGQIRDSQTGEVYGQILVEMGNRAVKEEFTSWDELMLAISVAAKRLNCRMDNAPLPTSQQEDCMKITAEDVDIFD